MNYKVDIAALQVDRGRNPGEEGLISIIVATLKIISLEQDLL